MCKFSVTALAVFLFSTSVIAGQGECDERSRQAERDQALLNPPASYKVAGEGRLYFYTDPDEGCRSKDVFVIPGDVLIAYTEFKGWYSVMYINPKTGKDYDGWVRTGRLRMMGSIRPAY